MRAIDGKGRVMPAAVPRSQAVAGDAVATRGFRRERRGYFICSDFDLLAGSMDQVDGLADIVVPGHDNYFLNVNS